MAVVKKKFFPVQIPILNKEIELYSLDAENLINRRVKLDLTNTLKGKAIELKLEVKSEEGQIIAAPIQAHLLPSYIRRSMRKGTDYVEDSFITQCKDHRIRIKPFLITRKRVSRKVLNALRVEAKKIIEEYVKEKSFDLIILDVINGNLQKTIQPKLKKIYPLGLCEIRFIGIEELKEHEKLAEEEEKEETAPKEEVKEVEAPAKEEREEETKKEKTEEKSEVKEEKGEQESS